MNNVENEAAKLLQDKRRLKRLLTLEKRRRGCAANELIFVGMHNVAQHWWCTQQAVLKSRVNEAMFFAVYLHDRITYASRLGLIDKLPRRNESLLDIGREIAFADVEKLRRKDEQKAAKNAKADKAAGIEVHWSAVDTVDQERKPVRFINPVQPEELKRDSELEAVARGLRVGDIEEQPLLRGKFFERSHAERYPTVRWNFPWRTYVVVGVPDGLTDEFVYEYKTTRTRWLLNFAKPVAFAQADLYGYFFRRQKKRVQFEIVAEGKTDTYEEPVDRDRAEETLAAFAWVDGGEPAHFPKPWKCRNCDFRLTCPITQARD